MARFRTLLPRDASMEHSARPGLAKLQGLVNSMANLLPYRPNRRMGSIADVVDSKLLAFE
jgi:hypothetical protein